MSTKEVQLECLPPRVTSVFSSQRFQAEFIYCANYTNIRLIDSVPCQIYLPCRLHKDSPDWLSSRSNLFIVPTARKVAWLTRFQAEIICRDDKPDGLGCYLGHIRSAYHNISLDIPESLLVLGLSNTYSRKTWTCARLFQSDTGSGLHPMGVLLHPHRTKFRVFSLE